MRKAEAETVMMMAKHLLYKAGNDADFKGVESNVVFITMTRVGRGYAVNATIMDPKLVHDGNRGLMYCKNLHLAFRGLEGLKERLGPLMRKAAQNWDQELKSA